ncbi:MAG: AbrB/MazE/SpoVT family DNA-binding domain-containing protein [Candidatus Berkelbacteria bacterium]|nr:AbrB/MazE/SpoVT family DNA-binding domain-containing protein [Candidatus Berkelbacteria bacterium]
MSKNIIKPTSRGQVTIPLELRTRLDISEETLLSVDVLDKSVVFTPVKLEKNQPLRQYSKSEIAQYLRDDKLSDEDARFFADIISKR